MSSYVEQSLTQGERILHIGRISPWSFFMSIVVAVAFFVMAISIFYFKRFFGGIMPNGLEGWVVAAIISIAPFLIGFFMLIGLYIKYKTTEFGITNRRVIFKRGLFRRETSEINLSRIESMNLKQNIIERMFNFGDIIIYGGGEMQSTILDVHDPMAFRKAFVEAQNPLST